MSPEITIDKFRYWIIAPYLLKKELSTRNYTYKYKTSTERNLIQFSTIFYGLISNTTAALIDGKLDSIEFQKICIVPVKFSEDEHFIIAFGELDGQKAVEFVKKNSRSLELELSKEFLSKIQSSDIFDNKVEPLLDTVPILLYLQPKENLFGESDKIDLVSESSNLINMLGAHRNHWSIIGDCLLASAVSAPWSGLIYIDTEKIRNDNSNIYITDFFLSLIKHVTSQNLLNYRIKQLKVSDLNKIQIQSLISKKSFNQTLELHWNVLSTLGQFNDYAILITNELPILKELNNSFLKRIAEFKERNRLAEPSYEYWKSATIIESLENDVSESLKEIEIDLVRLSSKSGIISSYSQDKINSEIAVVNINLQKEIKSLTLVMTILTILILIVTILVFIDSDLGKNLFNIFFGTTGGVGVGANNSS